MPITSFVRRPAVAGLRLAVLVLLVAATAAAEDTVWVLRDGRIETWRGVLVEERADGTVRLRTADGKVREFQGREIANIVRDPSAADAPPAAAPDAAPPPEAAPDVPAPPREAAPEVPAPPPAAAATPAPARPPEVSGGEPARGAARGARIMLRAWGGLAEPALDDVNRTLAEDEAAFAAAGADVRFDRFGRAPEFGAGLAVRAARGMSLGLEAGYQSSRADAAHEDAASAVSTTITLHVVDVLATAEMRLGAGLHLGAAAGVGLGRAVQDARLRDLADPANDEASHSEWEGAGFSGAAYARLEVPVGGAVAAFAQGGYRRRNLGTLAGETSAAGGETATEPADNAGNPVEFDFSGPYARAGLAIALGR